MAKPLQPHASFCTCAECTHAALHPSPPPFTAGGEIDPEGLVDDDGLVIDDEPCCVCGELHGDELTASQESVHRGNQEAVGPV